MDSINGNGATRKIAIEYAQTKYSTSPEYLWNRYPLYAVFRRSDNKKWYAVIMDVPQCKLGFDGHDKIDILDVKCDSVMREMFRRKQGFLPAYRLNKENWISVLLDGSVDIDTVFALIDASYAIAGAKGKT